MCLSLAPLSWLMVKMWNVYNLWRYFSFDLAGVLCAWGVTTMLVL